MNDGPFGLLAEDAAPDELLELAMAAPRTALDMASELLARATTASARSMLWRVMGNAERELINTSRSVECLAAARREAALSGDERLITLAELSWAATGSYAGTFEESVGLCRRAIEVLRGTPDEAIAWHQLAGVLGRQGQFTEALACGEQGLSLVDDSRPLLEAELHQNAGLALGYLGRFGEAIERTEFALARYEAARLDKRVADVLHNLGWLAVRYGDIGRANRFLQDAERRYACGVERDVHGGLWADRAAASELAGLWDEAYEMLGRHIAELDLAGNLMDGADTRLQRARVALRLDRSEAAEADAQEAARVFGEAKRWAWWGASTATEVRARWNRQHLRTDDVVVCSRALESMRGALVSDWIDAQLLLAEIALARGRPRYAHRRLGDARQAATTALDEVAVAAIQARADRALRSPTAALSTCRAGLEALARLRSTTGALDLQAHVGVHAARLTDEGVRAALAHGDPAVVLEWVEWRRGVSLAVPPVRVERDAELIRDASRLRDLEALGSAAREDAERLAREIAQRAHRVGGVSWVVDATDVAKVRSQLAGRTLVHLFTSDDRAYGLLTTEHGSELVELGNASALRREATHLSASLRRALHYPVTDGVVQRVRAEAARLDELLGAALPGSHAAVALCAPPELTVIPWGLLPSLAGSSMIVVPTARVLGRPSLPGQGVVLVAGPGLAHGAEELDELQAQYPNARVLAGDDATTQSVLAAIDGAELVHFGCHGSFNAYNPMFSSLTLADGPLYGYELASVTRAPRMVSMVACQSGAAARAGDEDGLGLNTVFLAAGTTAVLAARPAVPDSADTVSVSVGVHRALRDGDSLAGALSKVRRSHPLVGAAFDVVGDDVGLIGSSSLTS